MQYAYLNVTYRHSDNYTGIYDGKMANCIKKVRGNKTNQRPNQQQKQTNKQELPLIFLDFPVCCTTLLHC